MKTLQQLVSPKAFSELREDHAAWEYANMGTELGISLHGAFTEGELMEALRALREANRAFCQSR